MNHLTDTSNGSENVQPENSKPPTASSSAPDSPEQNAISLGSLKPLLEHLPTRQQRKAAMVEILQGYMATKGLGRKEAREAARLLARFGTLTLESPPTALAKLNRDMARFFRP
jgi:hypothetical protein